MFNQSTFPVTLVLILFKTINKVLLDNEKEFPGSQRIWLADTYDRLPDFTYGTPRAHGTKAPISKQWRSPFIGYSLRQIGVFIRGAPNPPKPLCKEFCAILRKEPYEERGEILICKIPPPGDNSEPQTIPTEYNTLNTFLIGFDREDWYIYFADQIM